MRYLRALGMWGLVVGSAATASAADGTPANKPADKSPAAVAADGTQAEHAAFLRRLSICTKLREVATATNNVDLLAQADRLETLATELYQKKLKVVEAAIMDAKAKEEALATAAAKKKDSARLAKAASDIVEYAPNGRPIRAKDAPPKDAKETNQ